MGEICVCPGEPCDFLAQAPNGQIVYCNIPNIFKGPVPSGTKIYVSYKPVASPMPLVMAQEQAAPPEGEDAEKNIVKESKGTSMVGTPKQTDMCPFAACCCAVISCYTKAPDCIGCYNQGVFLCCELETLCCKTGWNEGTADGQICLALKGEIEIIKPEGCCKLQEQLCCVNSACALPCDEEVPCMMSLLGITCVKNYKPVCEACKSMESTEVESGDRA